MAMQSSTHALRRTVVVGAGAVGSYYGALLALAGHPVTLIARPAHVQAIRAQGLQLQRGGQTQVVTLDASTELADTADADLVLVCVKSTDTEAVARQLAPLLQPRALVLSLQNGVENPALLARHLQQTVVPVAVYVAVSMPAPGVVSHHGRGDLVIGPRQRQAADDDDTMCQLQAVAALFGTAGVPVRISADVMDELWRKLMVNCAYNAISGLTQQPYGRMAALPEICTLQHELVREVVAVARADGQSMSLDAALVAMAQIAQAMPAQLSSTAQDMARGKPSEIDHLNGFIVRRGAELGVATPVNQAMQALVKLAETARDYG